MDLNNKEVLLDAKSIDLGFSTKSAIRQFDIVSKKEMLYFERNVKNTS